jgi:hypothetical protein
MNQSDHQMHPMHPTRLTHAIQESSLPNKIPRTAGGVQGWVKRSFSASCKLYCIGGLIAIAD